MHAAGQPRELEPLARVCDEGDVELGVVDHEFCIRDELEQPLGDVCESRGRFEIFQADAVHTFGTLLDITLGIE